ncbi:MAG: hypothetical protein IKQ97_00270 [Eubacterium sp.]|nr:hypothetical protein [Eubacterium sp.]
MQKGVYRARKKDGTEYFRASFTYRGKHISLGSFSDEDSAHQAYVEAGRITRDDAIGVEDYREERPLSFSKWVVLINFRDNGMYVKTPIYLKEKFFYYYFAPEDYLVFDSDDLFYYSTHSIMRREGHLFVADFGMQVNIRSRYGIKNFAVEGRDYLFLNGNSSDYRSSNLRIINRYHGVQKKETGTRVFFETKIHINGDVLVGRYRTEPEAAVAYNKAVKLLAEKGWKKNYPVNYVEEMDEESYRKCLETVTISETVTGWKGE